MKKLFVRMLFGLCSVISELFRFQSSRSKVSAGEKISYQDAEFFSNFGPRILLVRRDEEGKKCGHHLTGFFAMKFLFEDGKAVSGGPVVFSKGKNDLRFIGAKSVYSYYRKHLQSDDGFAVFSTSGVQIIFD